MARILLAREARGGLVETLQRGLGFSNRDVDGIFGGRTESEVTAFQTSHGLNATGAVDASTWEQATRQPTPELFQRALELTADFEGHGFTLAQGNFDGAGITWGIIGFTLASGEIAAIVQQVHREHPECIEDAFADLAAKLMEVVRWPLPQQLQFGDSISVGSSKIKLAEPWRTRFARFGDLPQVREMQLRHAREKYFAPALRTAEILGLRTELGVALAFDIHVQNGGVKEAAQSALRAQTYAAERDLRIALANTVADSSLPAYREDVRSRKLTLATGAGTVHGVSFTVKHWGLEELAA